MNLSTKNCDEHSRCFVVQAVCSIAGECNAIVAEVNTAGVATGGRRSRLPSEDLPYA